MRILVVEDDPALLQILEAGFRENRVDVVTARTFHEGREKAALGTYAVVILDVGLPGGSGFDLCKRIRSNGISTPVLMLTARDAVDDRVYGLESGADDYLTKPSPSPSRSCWRGCRRWPGARRSWRPRSAAWPTWRWTCAPATCAAPGAPSS